jgi:hypothetical protein
MGAPAAASLVHASPSATARAARTPTTPVVSGLPEYMTVVESGAAAGAAQGRIEALQQQDQTDDRSVVEDLADRIGQSEARERMQAEDAGHAARSEPTPRNRASRRRRRPFNPAAPQRRVHRSSRTPSPAQRTAAGSWRRTARPCCPREQACGGAPTDAAAGVAAGGSRAQAALWRAAPRGKA